MSRSRVLPWTHLALWLFAAVALACGNEPIPRRVLQGASFTVQLSGEYLAAQTGNGLGIDLYDIGFGGEWYWDSLQFRDVQRGEVQFYLDTPTPSNILETDFITRVFPDPATDVARNDGDIEGLAHGLGEIQALVFVPCGAPSGLHNLKARKIYRESTGDLNDSGPSGFPVDLIYERPIEIVATSCTGDTNRSDPYSTFGGSTSWWNTDPAGTINLYPDPKILIAFPTGLPEPPSAAHLEIDILNGFPGDIIDVIEEQHFGRGSAINWELTPTGIVIDYVNPQPSPNVIQLALVYQPHASYMRLQSDSDAALRYFFWPMIEEFWDASGNTVSGNVTFGPIR